MKFIGQYIQQLIARFRADVYLESLSDTSETGVLVVDSAGKISKNAGISSGVAGTVTLANEGSDQTCFPAFVTAATGDLALKTNSSFTFDSLTGALSSVTFTTTGIMQCSGLVAGASGISSTSTNAAAAGPVLNLTKNRNGASAVNNDEAGEIQFNGVNDAGTPESISYAQIVSSSALVTDGDERGKLELKVANDGTLRNGITFLGTDTAEEVDVTIGNGAASLTTIAGDLAITGGNITNAITFDSGLSGTLTGSSTSCTGQAATVATIAGLAPNTATTAAAQPNITSLGTLTSLDVDQVNINNARIILTGDTDDTFAITCGTHGATTIETTDTAAAAANLGFNIDGAITATSTSFSAITDDFTISSPTSGHPTLTIAHTGNNNQGGELVLHNKRGSAGVDGDICGLIHFKAPNHDGSDNFIFYSSIVGSIVESNDTDEAGKLELYVSTSDGSSSSPQAGLILTGSASSNDVDVSIGSGATSVTTIAGRARSTSSGDFSIPFRIFGVTSDTDGSFDGDVVRFGSTTSMTTGAIYHYNSSGNWELANATNSTKSDGLLGVALGAASDTNGVLLRGMVTLDHDPGAVGDVLFLSTTAGDCSSTAPSGNGNIVRIIGYCLDASNGQVWFNPDNTFVEYAT
tara:strand:+ start:8859 stop:10769 length:1911 start_codon:yes stop_codon:yes gene_type:complete